MLESFFLILYNLDSKRRLYIFINCKGDKVVNEITVVEDSKEFLKK